jgi:gliding motility-associated-like protein
MKKITFILCTFLITLTGFSQFGPEGFENTSSPTLPTWTLGTGDWAVFDNAVGTVESWNINSSVATPNIVYAGANSAFMTRENIGGGNTSEDYLATPLITVPANGQLRFWTRTFTLGNQGTIYQIKVAPATANQFNPAAYNLVQQWTEDQLTATYNIYEQKTVSLSAFAGQQVYISFVMRYPQPLGQAGIGGDRWLVDNVDVIQQCLVPTTLTATAITATSASLSWANPSGATSWEIEVLPAANAPTGVGVIYSGPLPYVVTGLSSITQYKYLVRASCSATNFSPYSAAFNFTTAPGPVACGGNFLDVGGLTGPYLANTNTTTTICPSAANPTFQVTVTFTSFNTEATYDGMYVYDGNSAAAPLISSGNPAGAGGGAVTTPGAFWGTTIPGPFTSSAPNGCLTFVFRSDGSVQNPGWVSNITCTAPPTCPKPTALVRSNLTATTMQLAWTSNSTATTWQILRLPCGSPLPTATSTGFITATTNPFTITGLTPDTCYDFYVRGVCGPTDLSLWSVASSATTPQILPPPCGGTFSDIGGASANYTNNTDDTVTVCPANVGDAVTVTFTSFNTQATADGLYIYDGNNTTTAPLIPSTNPAGTVPGGLAGSYWGTTIPGPFTSTAPNGCLTFRFRSGATVNATGWTSNVTCAPAPTCARPKTLTVTNITQTSATLGWTQTTNFNGSGPATVWQVLLLPCGSPTPTPAATGWVTVGANPFNYTGLTASTCYDFYVRAVCSASDLSAWSIVRQFKTLLINDDCSGSIQLPVNQNTNCTQTVPGTIDSATASVNPNTCGAAIDDDDVWYYFVATAATHYVSFFDVTGTGTLNYAVYRGADCNNLVQVGACTTLNGGVLNSLVVGETYSIRVYSAGTVATTKTFNLCIGTKIIECPNSLPLCAITPIILPNNVGVPSNPNPVNGSASTTVGCLGSAPSPTYYYLVIPTSGNYTFFMEQNTLANFTGTGLDIDYVSWGPYTSTAVACATISPANTRPAPLGCSFSGNPTETLTLTGAVAGQVYVIMITNYTASVLPGQKGFIRITQTSGPIPASCCPYTNFSYSSSFYCKNGANPSPILFSGATAGTYSCPNPALALNPTTGQINLAASAAGTYIITSTIGAAGQCTASINTYTVTITNPPVATLAYSAPNYCISNTTVQTPTQTGAAGGSYSVTPLVGLSLTPSGSFVPSTSLAGTYTVRYTIQAASGCPATEVPTTVVIDPIISAVTGFTYPTPICKNAANPSPTTVAGFTTGGTYGISPLSTTTTGLTINATTGAIDLAASTAGTYLVRYATPSDIANCKAASFTDFQIVITPTTTPVTGFTYVSPVCSYNPNPTPITNSGFEPGGIYTATPAGLSINSATGVVTLATSTPGSYVVRYTTAANTTTCKLTSTSTANLVLSTEVMAMVTGECEGPVFVLKSGVLNNSYVANAATYQWSTSSGTLLGTAANQSVTELGTYSVKVTNTSGCFGIANITVDAITCSVPKGISVNGDGINDVWDLTGFKVKQLNIFNRYGQKVYSKSEYKKEWGGQTDKGDELPDGTYFYVIERVGFDSISGWVYVNRALN